MKGVSGAGKSTLGAAIAEHLGLPYEDGDDLHPKENVDKMSRGEPLNDADRLPWLKQIRERGVAACREGDGVVIGCSALKVSYRDILRGKESAEEEKKDGPAFPTRFVFISGSREELFERMSHRKGHYMKASMLESQLTTLETPDLAVEKDVVQVNLVDPTPVQVAQAIKSLEASLL